MKLEINAGFSFFLFLSSAWLLLACFFFREMAAQPTQGIDEELFSSVIF